MTLNDLRWLKIRRGELNLSFHEKQPKVGQAAEAEAVGGLPGLLRSPSLAGLYVIVGHGAPANGSG